MMMPLVPDTRGATAFGLSRPMASVISRRTNIRQKRIASSVVDHRRHEYLPICSSDPAARSSNRRGATRSGGSQPVFASFVKILQLWSRRRSAAGFLLAHVVKELFVNDFAVLYFIDRDLFHVESPVFRFEGDIQFEGGGKMRAGNQRPFHRRAMNFVIRLPHWNARFALSRRPACPADLLSAGVSLWALRVRV
jgi:hypothetical protein